jgi:hypothetical protein
VRWTRVKQHEAVIQAMRASGGYATLGQLYRTATRVPGVHWGTKTSDASIRRIVQKHKEFFKIRPGLWALASQRDEVLAKLDLDAKFDSRNPEEFNHTYYQGLLVQIGNLKDYETFVPPQDKNRPFLGRKLAEVATLKKLYGFTYDSLLQRAKTIDVSWFNDRRFPKAFFEVEHSTPMWNSLVKFKDFEDFRVKYYIVADAKRRKEFERKISSSAYSSIKDAVKFLSYGKLSEWHTQVFKTVPIDKELGL